MIDLDNILLLETAVEMMEEALDADYSFIDGFINESNEEELPYV